MKWANKKQNNFNIYNVEFFQKNDVQFLRFGVRQAEFFVILVHFLPFQLPDNPENQIFKIEKNTWRYYIILHICTINDMVPETWSATDRIFCHSGPFFALLLPMNPDNQNFGKMNNTPDNIIILQMCTINHV